MKPHRLEVRFADIDVMGHVNNAIFLNYFEQGRIAFFRQHNQSDWDWSKYGIIVARNEVDYLKPVLLHDEVYVTAEFGKMGNKSFQMIMRVFRKVDDTEVDCAKGVVTLVCFDYKQQKTIPVPDEWRSSPQKK